MGATGRSADAGTAGRPRRSADATGSNAPVRGLRMLMDFASNAAYRHENAYEPTNVGGKLGAMMTGELGDRRLKRRRRRPNGPRHLRPSAAAPCRAGGARSPGGLPQR